MNQKNLLMNTAIDCIFQSLSPTEQSHLLARLVSSQVLRQALNQYLQLLIKEDTSQTELDGSMSSVLTALPKPSLTNLESTPNIDSAHALSSKPEQRIKFQADIQDYVDQSISSTINLPNAKDTTENDVTKFAKVLARYGGRLRGFTCYPDGSRGGQPITSVNYEEAIKHKGVVYEENDPCGGGVCGV